MLSTAVPLWNGTSHDVESGSMRCRSGSRAYERPVRWRRDPMRLRPEGPEYGHGTLTMACGRIPIAYGIRNLRDDIFSFENRQSTKTRTAKGISTSVCGLYFAMIRRNAATLYGRLLELPCAQLFIADVCPLLAGDLPLHLIFFEKS